MPRNERGRSNLTITPMEKVRLRMASLPKDRRLLFKAPDGKRNTIRLGAKTPMKQAQVIQRHVERLVACQIDGSAPPEETSWRVSGVSQTLRDRLVRAGFIQSVATAKRVTIGELIDRYKAHPAWQTLKPNTRKTLRWGDVDWENRRFRVTSPKNERHKDGGRRWVPMFPELANPI